MVAVTGRVPDKPTDGVAELVSVTVMGAGLTVTVRVAVLNGSVLEATVTVAMHCEASIVGGV
jgi:hypothetical protein